MIEERGRRRKINSAEGREGRRKRKKGRKTPSQLHIGLEISASQYFQI